MRIWKRYILLVDVYGELKLFLIRFQELFKQKLEGQRTSKCLDAPYDGYAECVKIHFDPAKTSILMLMDYLFEMINPYSLNQQGQDKGQKYRTGVYSESSKHLNEAKDYIKRREDAKQVMVEVQPLSNYVKSAE